MLGRVKHPALVTAIVVAALAALVVLAGSGADDPVAGRRGADGPPLTGACQPPPAGSLRLPAIDGRVGVVVRMPATRRVGAPLVLALPGAGQTAAGFGRSTGYSLLADRAGFVVAYPTAAGERPSWNVSGKVPGRPDDVAYLRKVIAAVLKATCADKRRVGVTGVSSGGGMSARLACDAADLIAAAAPVAGGYGSLPACRPSVPVALLEIHGTGDRVVPYAGREPDAFGAVEPFVAAWRTRDGCPDDGRVSMPQPGVTELSWAPCRLGSAVAQVRIDGEPHGWPGGADIDGTRAFSSTARTWAFLSAYRR